MFFSIIMPVYNGEKYLSRAVQSVRAQSFKDFELILIDDGSKDHSADICKKIADKDNRIKVLEQENKGALLARKNGVQLAQGRYHVFIDCDDMIETNMLEIIYQNLTKNPADLLLFNYYKINYAGKKTKGENFLETGKIYTGKDLLLLSMNFKLPNSLCTKVVRGNISKKSFSVYDQNLSMAEDRLISLQIFQRINTGYYINAYLYDYFDNESSSMHNFQLKFFSDYEFVYDEELSIIDRFHLGDSEKIFLTRGRIVEVLRNLFFYVFQNEISSDQFINLCNFILSKSYFKLLLTSASIGSLWRLAYKFLIHRQYRILYLYYQLLKVGYKIKHFRKSSRKVM